MFTELFSLLTAADHRRVASAPREQLEMSWDFLAAVLDGCRDAIVVEDAGVVVYCNRACVELYRYAAPSDSIKESSRS
jgi:PAS domain-containing protein